MHRVSFGFLWATAVVGSAAIAHADHAISVTAGTRPLRNCPIRAAAPKEPAGKNLLLVDASTKEEIPAQFDDSEGQPAIWFVIGELPAGQTREFRLKEGTSAAPRAGVLLEESAAGLDIKIDGQLFTTYRTQGGPKPFWWPIIGPTGKPVTRSFPMERIRGETFDHIHHRSLWFTHGKVNGNDFWSEMPTAGKTVHREFVRKASGPVFGLFTSRVDWVGRKGDLVCEDLRTMRVFRVADARLFDLEFVVRANRGPLTFGDDKEGTFAFRVADSMAVNRRHGVLINANGDKDGKAWGAQAPWADYSGPVDGKTVGIAILEHPTSFRAPTYWHARDYGLFAANPFGLSFFKRDKKQDGSHTIPAGGAAAFRYRVLIHPGDAQAGGVADAFDNLANPPKVVVR